jgi:hypothetical protein
MERLLAIPVQTMRIFTLSLAISIAFLVLVVGYAQQQNGEKPSLDVVIERSHQAGTRLSDQEREIATMRDRLMRIETTLDLQSNMLGASLTLIGGQIAAALWAAINRNNRHRPRE